ncbi:tRNA lysidine(34) synthetase TilS [Borrelia sp. HM]|uniref:tRNA lysidine(34) synthetase TilS n=1 Tax=Borrelia sp. HM TaxID=1882662 RepID=UPI001C78E6E1|nr:tRNA lysidine(34) synthetase TilS [Borrelia sp. HM]BCR22196.1 tRNA(Ile)-lysidine synthase [Borrelia sp. HM]
MFWNNIISKIDNFYENNSLTKEKVVVAFSGGADSTVLLLSLQKYLNNNVIALYFAHNIRSKFEQNLEIEHVKKFCNCHNITIQIKECSIDINRESKQLHMSIEDLARKYRYNALFEALIENKAKYIAIAHNKNDQFETLVMRFFQGSFLDGFSGIPIINGNIIRPLLEASRKEIEEFLSLNNIVYFVDSTNLENFYLRNRIRNTLIPVIKKIFKGYERGLERISDFSSELVNYFDEKNLLPFTRGNYYYSFDVVTFFSLPKYLVFRSIFKILNLEGIVSNLSYGALGEIFRVKPIDKRSKILLKTNDFFLEKRKDRINLIFKGAEKMHEPFDFLLKLNEYHSLSLGKILLKYLECEDDSILALRCCSYEFRHRFFKNKLQAKRFFSKFVRHNPLYLMLLVLNEKIIGIIDLNTLKLMWSDRNILKKINISLFGGFLKE